MFLPTFLQVDGTVAGLDYDPAQDVLYAVAKRGLQTIRPQGCCLDEIPENKRRVRDAVESGALVCPTPSP